MCPLCGGGLSGASVFSHRDVDMVLCGICGHVATRHLPGTDYDARVHKALGYEGIYPAVNEAAYAARTERVYTPKAQWIFESLPGDPKTLTWCDIGCGAGNFLKSLQSMDCTRLSGVDIDEHNLSIAEKMVGTNIVRRHDGTLDQVFQKFPADIYTAFFVFEHVPDMTAVARAVKALPKGTHLAFAVPMFGFITLFESIWKHHYPRNLDAMMHTQMFTDRSVDYFLNAAGLEKTAEWVFGQDAIDVRRYLMVNLKDRYPAPLYAAMMDKVNGMVDSLQAVIDRAHMADARHILAVRV